MKFKFADRITAIADEKYSGTEKENTTMSATALEVIKASAEQARIRGINVPFVDKMLARAGVQLDAEPNGKILISKFDDAVGKTRMSMDEKVRIKNILRGLGLLAREVA
jgi:hypothetical protein